MIDKHRKSVSIDRHSRLTGRIILDRDREMIHIDGWLDMARLEWKKRRQDKMF
jgi:hypothetical protein